MDFAKQFMGVDFSTSEETSGLDENIVEIETTNAPQHLSLHQVLLDRHWVFEEVLYIKGGSTNLSRLELQEAVAETKEVDMDRVDVCFFDEDELSHALVTDETRLGAAGLPKGDVVCIWKTKYKPANFRLYSKKWRKIEKRMNEMPAR